MTEPYSDDDQSLRGIKDRIVRCPKCGIEWQTNLAAPRCGICKVGLITVILKEDENERDN